VPVVQLDEMVGVRQGVDHLAVFGAPD